MTPLSNEKLIDIISKKIAESVSEAISQNDLITKALLKEAEIEVEQEEDDVFYDLARKLKERKPFWYEEKVGFWLWDDEKGWVRHDDKEDTVIPHFSRILPETVTEDGKEVQIRKKISKPLIRNRLLTAMRDIGITEKPKILDTDWIAFKNRIVNIKTGEELDTSPKYFVPNQIPHNIADDDETPTIDELLYDWMDGNKDKVKQLYEIMAYTLYRGYPIQRFFFLFGSGHNGKGQYLGIIRRLVGDQNTVSFRIQDLGNDKFSTSILYKKLVAFTEEPSQNTKIGIGTIKSLTGDDLIKAEFKQKNPFFFKNYAKIIIATNVIPWVVDTSHAYYRRTLIIHFPKTYEDKEKPVINKIPEEEYEALGRKLIKILKDLLNRGHFWKEPSERERRKIYEYYANPVIEFVQTYCEKDESAWIPNFVFEERLNKWLARKFRWFKYSWQMITATLEELGFETGVRDYVEINGEQKRVRGIRGLKFKDKLSDYVDMNYNSFGTDRPPITYNIFLAIFKKLHHIYNLSVPKIEKLVEDLDPEIKEELMRLIHTHLGQGQGVESYEDVQNQRLHQKNDDMSDPVPTHKPIYVDNSTDPDLQVFKKWFSHYSSPLLSALVLTQWILQEFYDQPFTVDDIVKRVLKDPNQRELAEAWVSFNLRNGELIEIQKGKYKFANPNFLLNTVPEKLDQLFKLETEEVVVR